MFSSLGNWNVRSPKSSNDDNGISAIAPTFTGRAVSRNHPRSILDLDVPSSRQMTRSERRLWNQDHNIAHTEARQYSRRQLTTRDLRIGAVNDEALRGL